MRHVKVRQALEYAIDKSAIVRIHGGPNLATPLNQIIPPGNSGYEEFNLYPTANNAGDPDKCRSLLAEAGYPHGMTLKMVSRNSGKHPDVAQSVQADLKKCGITVNIIPVTRADFYGKYLNSPEGSKRGVWDIAAPSWVPDWFDNNGRTFIAALFDGRTYGPNSVNYGDYNNPAVNNLIDKALAESDAGAAAKLWHQADMQIMKDAAIVPFKTDKTAIYHASRVHNAVFLPFSQNYDITNVWLK
jgi:peptide/nickel transport system substrate-binding protein